jgi:DNA polymerase III subunit alpha
VLPYEVAFTDDKLLKKAIDEADRPLAGKHMPWEEFCVEFADIVSPMRDKYPEVFALTDRVIGRVKTYGKHAAGVVISTDRPLTDLPMRVDDEGNMVTQFDMNALERLGYVKFDILTLRTLDTIQTAVDLIRDRYGIEVNVYEWREEYDDPQVWDEVAAGRTLGLFQVETRAGTRLTKRYRPANLHDLAAVMTLVRPGPVRSGLTETYLRRRDGLEPVTFPDPRMEVALGDTYGAIIYQEQIMAACMVLAGYDGNEADEVRSILGKKKVEKIVPAGQKFLERAKANATEERVAAPLWEQMAEFAKYSFNKAHAFGYSVLGYWTAWLKFHFPVQFLTAALSTVDADRIPEFIGEAKRMGYSILPPCVNESGVAFTQGQTSVRYGLASVKGIGEPTALQIIKGQPYRDLDDFLTRQVEPKGSAVDRGHLAVLVGAGAFDAIVSNRRAVELQLEADKTGASKTCLNFDRNTLGPGGLPCRFDWANEPDPPMVAKGRGKDKTYERKSPPKKCTVACRQYAKPAPIDVDLVRPYTDDDIRAREKELLGVWLSSTPFDRLDPSSLEDCATAEELETAPPGEYFVAAIIKGVKVKRDRNNNNYAWVTLETQDGEMDMICFATTYEKFRQNLQVDSLVLVHCIKTDRGVNLLALLPV